MNLYLWFEHLALCGLVLNLTDDIHALDDLTEGSKSLFVWISLAAKIQIRLVMDADEYLRRCGPWLVPRHRDHTVCMLDTGHFCRFMLDGRKPFFTLAETQSSLDNFDFHIVVRLVVHCRSAR